MEDAEDYAAFELAVTSDHDACTAVERELVLRLASLLWRLRRATAIESGLFEMQAQQLLQFRRRRTHHERQNPIGNIYRFDIDPEDAEQKLDEPSDGPANLLPSNSDRVNKADDLTLSFVRLSNLSTYPLDRLINNIQLLRGLAALAVAFYHAGYALVLVIYPLIGKQSDNIVTTAAALIWFAITGSQQMTLLAPPSIVLSALLLERRGFLCQHRLALALDAVMGRPSRA